MNRATDPLHAEVRRYTAAIVAMEKAPVPRAAWALAEARTGLDIVIGAGRAAEQTLVSIVSLDQRARVALGRMPAGACPAFETMRDARGDGNGQWWWTPSRWVARPHDVFLTLGVLTFWGLALAITSDTIARWLAGSPDWTSIVAIVVQALVTMLGGAAFLEQGRSVFQRVAALLGQPIGRWQQLAILGTCAVLVAVLILRLSLPGIAALYGCQGQTHFEAGRLSSALQSWRRAVALDPDPWQYHYSLGSVLERQADFDSAIAQYKLAIATPTPAAFAVNNLARLYLVEKNDAVAALTLLDPAVHDYKRDDIVLYRLFINRGAAFLALKLDHLAQFDGAAALALAQRLNWAGAPSASCLLALSAEKAPKKTTFDNWKTCMQSSSEDRVSDPRWIAMAREELLKEPQ